MRLRRSSWTCRITGGCRMIECYSNVFGITTPGCELKNSCWVNLTAPLEKEVRQVSETLGIPMDFLTDPLDLDERARIELDEELPAHCPPYPCSGRGRRPCPVHHGSSGNCGQERPSRDHIESAYRYHDHLSRSAGEELRPWPACPFRHSAVSPDVNSVSQILEGDQQEDQCVRDGAASGHEE